MDCRPLRTVLYFEELEPRMLYSADLAGVIDTEVPEQDVEEEPVITADLESTEESDATQQEEDEESAPSTLSTEPMEPAEELESSAGDVGAVEETEEAEEATGSESLQDTAETGPADTSLGSSAVEKKDSASTTADDSSDAPVITMPDTAVEYAPGDPPAILAPAATVGDDDSDNFFQGTLTVSISEGCTDDDQLLIVEGGDVSLLNNNIKVEQKLVGSFAGGSDGTALVISWTPQATPDCAEAVLRQIAYYHDSAEPVPGSRTVEFVLTDGDGGTSNTVQAIVNAAGDPGQGEGDGDGAGETGGGEEAPGENIAPVLTQTDGPFDYVGGAPAILIAPAATIVDVDSEDFKQGTLTVSFSAGGSEGDRLLIVEGGDVWLLNNKIKVEQKLVGSFAGGTDGAALVISWSPQATPAYAEAVLRQIAYCTGSAEPVPGSRTVEFVLTDGDGGTSNTVQAVINITGTGAPGSDPGQGVGGGENDTGGGEVPPPVGGEEDTPKPVASGGEVPPPVGGEEDTPKPVASGGEQEDSEGGRQDPSGGDGVETLTPTEPPASEPVRQDLEFKTKATDGSRSAMLSVPRNLPDEPHSPQEFREKDDPVGRVGMEDHAGQERVAPPRSDGSTEYGKVAEGYGFSLPEQPAAPVVQGQETGDVPREATLSDRLKTTMDRLLGFLTPSAATAAPAPPLDHDSAAGDTPAESELVCREVEIMRLEMEEAFLQSNRVGKLMVYTTTGVSLSLAAGIARYFFHSGSLLSGFLATIPLWKGFDPVAILRTQKNDRKKAGAKSPSVGVEPVDHKAETMFAAAGGDA